MKTSHENHPVQFLAAGGPLRACEEEFMGTGHKLIATTNAVESVFVYAYSFRGENTCETINFLF